MTAPPRVGLRPVTEQDRPFLLALYASTRAAELDAVPWDDATRAAFLSAQFALREAAYRSDAPQAHRSVVLVDGEPAGRLDVDHRGAEMRVVDIALLPAFRGRGVGGRLLRDLTAAADAAGTPLTLHVERTNPAGRLYARLGFRVAEELGVHLRLTRPVPRKADAPVAGSAG